METKTYTYELNKDVEVISTYNQKVKKSALTVNAVLNTTIVVLSIISLLGAIL